MFFCLDHLQVNSVINNFVIFLTVNATLGLSPDISTLPSLLKLYKNYSTAMVGKWHLGHAQHKMTPTGRGFDSFTGENAKFYLYHCDASAL